jgi:hypothetical protein
MTDGSAQEMRERSSIRAPLLHQKRQESVTGQAAGMRSERKGTMAINWDKPADRRTARPPDDVREVVVRRCKVCEWEGEVIETGGDTGNPDCPWCHGPTERKATLASSVPAGAGTKNPHAAALGRLGGMKGGRARAEALTPTQRRRIASRAARARWGKEKKKKDQKE